MGTVETTGGSNAFIEMLRAKAKKPVEASATADRCWGLEEHGDPVLTVETARGGVCITHYDCDEDGDTVAGFSIDAVEARWLHEHLGLALKLLDLRAGGRPMNGDGTDL